MLRLVKHQEHIDYLLMDSFYKMIVIYFKYHQQKYIFRQSSVFHLFLFVNKMPCLLYIIHMSSIYHLYGSSSETHSIPLVFITLYTNFFRILLIFLLVMSQKYIFLYAWIIDIYSFKSFKVFYSSYFFNASSNKASRTYRLSLEGLFL